jgi:hypothetical protein
MCVKTNLARAETLMTKLLRVHSENAEYRARCFHAAGLVVGWLWFALVLINSYFFWNVVR